MSEFVTLPELSHRHTYSLDQLRELVRRNPDLNRLGRRFGAVRVFTAAEGEQIVKAMEERRAKRRPVAAAC